MTNDDHANDVDHDHDRDDDDVDLDHNNEDDVGKTSDDADKKRLTLRRECDWLKIVHCTFC